MCKSIKYIYWVKKDLFGLVWKVWLCSRHSKCNQLIKITMAITTVLHSRCSLLRLIYLQTSSSFCRPVLEYLECIALELLLFWSSLFLYSFSFMLAACTTLLLLVTSRSNSCAIRRCIRLSNHLTLVDKWSFIWSNTPVYKSITCFKIKNQKATLWANVVCNSH